MGKRERDIGGKRARAGRGRLAAALAAAALALPAGAGAQGNLSISDTLLQYQLYGRNWVRIEGDAVTAQDGGVGSDKHVDITNNNVRINGNLASGDRITAMSNLDVTGSLNARGDVTLTDDGNSVLGAVNIGGTLTLSGGNPMGNTFGSPIKIATAPVALPGWASNTWAGTAITGPVTPGNRPPGFQFGVNDPFPAAWTRFPDTTVDFDASKDCVVPVGTRFNMSLCGLGGGAADTLLPPGRYGDFEMLAGSTLYLRSGTYHFKSFEIRSDGCRLLFVQPGNALTKVLIQDFFTVNDGNQLVAPVKYADPGFKGGTVYFYVEGVARLKDDNRFWATLVGKNHVHVESGLRLFGQILGDCLTIENGFNGGPGFGKYIPLNPKAKGPLKYSIIHHKHPD